MWHNPSYSSISSFIKRDYNIDLTGVWHGPNLTVFCIIGTQLNVTHFFLISQNLFFFVDKTLTHWRHSMILLFDFIQVEFYLHVSQNSWLQVTVVKSYCVKQKRRRRLTSQTVWTRLDSGTQTASVFLFLPLALSPPSWLHLQATLPLWRQVGTWKWQIYMLSILLGTPTESWKWLSSPQFQGKAQSWVLLAWLCHQPISSQSSWMWDRMLWLTQAYVINSPPELEAELVLPKRYHFRLKDFTS